MLLERFASLTALGAAMWWSGLAAAQNEAPAKPPAVVEPAASQPAKKKLSPLEQARDDLRMSELTLRRIQRNLDALREDPAVDPLVVADYMRYLEVVRAMAERQRAVVKEMEAIGGPPAPTVPSGDWPEVEPIRFDPKPPVVEDELTRLERELSESLSAFDEFLLREQNEATRRMERIDQASDEEMTDLAQEAADAVERLRDRGIDVDTSAPESGEPGAEGNPGAEGEEGAEGAEGSEGAAGGGGLEGEEGEGMGGAEGEQGAEGAESEGPEGSPGGASGSGEGEQSGGGAPGEGDGTGGDEEGEGNGSGVDGDSQVTPPGDRPPADDDDIVARQLREAAERETDPVLKEKLWQEYERYKGIR